MDTYTIRRFHFDEEHPDHRKVIEQGVSLEQAQAHCNDEATHELDWEGLPIWFDGYERE